MPSKRDKAKRWQFGLIWLFVATLAVAFSCVLWIADPASWALVTSWALSLILPAGSVSGAVFFRGYRRAFFIGMAVTQVIYATGTVYQGESVLPMTMEAVPLSQSEFMSPSPVYVDAPGLAKRTVVVIGLSLVSGLLAAAVCWFAIRTDDSAPHS